MTKSANAILIREMRIFKNNDGYQVPCTSHYKKLEMCSECANDAPYKETPHSGRLCKRCRSYVPESSCTAYLRLSRYHYL